MQARTVAAQVSLRGEYLGRPRCDLIRTFDARIHEECILVATRLALSSGPSRRSSLDDLRSRARLRLRLDAMHRSGTRCNPDVRRHVGAACAGDVAPRDLCRRPGDSLSYIRIVYGIVDPSSQTTATLWKMVTRCRGDPDGGHGPSPTSTVCLILGLVHRGVASRPHLVFILRVRGKQGYADGITSLR
jgi:hypothetical protein